MPRLRVAFMGTPAFAVPVLRALIERRYDLAAVYTQPPRPAGRGHAVRPTPVQVQAVAAGIAVRTPATLAVPGEQQAFRELGLDAAVVAAYGLILPPAVLAAPRLGCLNVHASLLPRWRGAAPIQRAILAGDERTGVTIMQMDEGLDTGALLLAEATPIGPDEDAGALHDRLAAIGARLVVDALDALAEGRLRPRPQPEAGATYARKIGRDEARLDWRRPAAELARRVRAFAPAPGAHFDHGGERIRVLAAEPVAGERSGAPGTVLDDGLLVACGEGGLRLTRLQRPGRSVMAAAEFLRGFPLRAGTALPPPGAA
jgi:methionyl-tRNA formyltransferase